MKSKHYLPPWAIALIGALVLHIIVIALLNVYGGFDFLQPKKTADKQKLEVTFIDKESKESKTSDDQATQEKPVAPAATVTEAPSAPASTITPPTTEKSAEKTAENSTPQVTESLGQTKINSEGNITPIQPMTDEKTETTPADHQLAKGKTGDISTKSSLLDLSHFSLSPAAGSDATKEIFSAELQKKIATSKQAQKDYLKGTKKQTSYPITEDADGTRYVNIKGVCWRMPKDANKGSWAIVFDGCGLKNKSFHFELNINPSMLTNELLGPDSPFTLEK